MGKYQEAVDDCRKCLQIKPDYPKVIKRLAQGLIALDKIDEAKQVLEQAVLMDPENKGLMVDEIKMVKEIDEIQSCIEKQVKNKNWNSALYFVNDKLRHCPGSTKLKLDKVEYLMEAGSDEAGKYSQQLFDELNGNPRYLYLRGMILINEGKLDQGKKFLMQALKNDPDFAKCQKAVKKVKKMDSLKTEASASFKSGDYETAIKGFTA